MFFKKRITQKQLIKFLLDYDPMYKTSNIRMQKALFIIFGTLSKEDIDYLDVESFKFERWMYGPVNKELYFNYKAGLLSSYDGVKVKFSDKLKEKVESISDYLMEFSNTDLIHFIHDLNCWIEKRILNVWKTQKLLEILNTLLWSITILINKSVEISLGEGK